MGIPRHQLQQVMDRRPLEPIDRVKLKKPRHFAVFRLTLFSAHCYKTSKPAFTIHNSLEIANSEMHSSASAIYTRY